MKKLRGCRVASENGDLHFVLEEYYASDHPKTFQDLDIDEIKEISKKQAAKPLILFRQE